MDNYKLRSDLRNLDESLPDADGSSNFILPKSLLVEIEQKLFELDSMATLSHNYKAVLKDVLK